MLNDDKSSENISNGTGADSEARCSEEEIYLEAVTSLTRDLS